MPWTGFTAYCTGRSPASHSTKLSSTQPDTNFDCLLTWHLTRVQDNGISGLFDQEQAWIRGWHAKFGMEADPDNGGKGTHQRKWLPFVPPPSNSCWTIMTASQRGPKPL